MTKSSTERFIEAAIAEDGQPISAGGRPLRNRVSTEFEAQENGKFRTAAELEAGQPVVAGEQMLHQQGVRIV